MRAVGWLALLLLLMPPAAADQIAERLVGRPDSQATCDAKGCRHESLSSTEQRDHTTVITRSADRYLWTSRDGQLLRRYEVGAYTILFDPNTGHSVKFSLFPEGCRYLEDRSDELTSVAYWGACDAE